MPTTNPTTIPWKLAEVLKQSNKNDRGRLHIVETRFVSPPKFDKMRLTKGKYVKDKNGHDFGFWITFKWIVTSPSDTPTFVLSSISIVDIEPRVEDASDEPKDTPVSFNMLDIGLSQIVLEYDGLSKLRGQSLDFSLLQDI